MISLHKYAFMNLYMIIIIKKTALKTGRHIYIKCYRWTVGQGVTYPCGASLIKKDNSIHGQTFAITTL